MTTSSDIQARFRWFRETMGVEASAAFACARAEIGFEKAQEEDPDLTVTVEEENYPDWSHYDQEDVYTPSERERIMTDVRRGHLHQQRISVETKATCNLGHKHREVLASVGCVEVREDRDSDNYLRYETANLLIEAGFGTLASQERL